ncbi:biotin transporter BioY [Dactylosporangium roseum]|uniref:biotin transporter BioY n=1 Tax=Dactylosporangium roseum TaxID=47989 RepID=UPI0021B46219|nr:biotin transporter BioY [Dactylosporangium roseum]
MSDTYAVPPRVLADLVPGALARDAVLVGLGAALTGGAAQVAVSIEPISPVPLTGQTLAVLLVGAVLGPARGAASMVLYLAAGLAGLPWFADGASGAALVSLGYVIGFVVAGAVVGELARRGGDRTPLRTAGTMVIGNLCVYAFGVPYLAVAAHLSPAKALDAGVVPFLAGDALKVLLATALLPAAWAVVRRVRDDKR